MSANEALHTAATALRTIVTRPLAKGVVSQAVTQAIPSGLSAWCRGCGTTHIREQLLRLAAPLAGLVLEPGTSPATLTPLRGRPRIPTSTDLAGATTVMRTYLRLHGPAGVADAAGFLGTTATRARPLWPDDVVEVSLNSGSGRGRRCAVPTDVVGAVENPPEPPFVRLLPPWDPLLQARDRALLVPDPALRKEVWKSVGNPGALLVDGEVAGVWRATKSGTGLRVRFTTGPRLPALARDEAESEADRLRRARGYTSLRVSWS